MNGSSTPLLIDALGSIPGFFGIRFDEEPAYHMEDIVGAVEIRRYAPALHAFVLSEATDNAALAEARQKLRSYIYGENGCRKKMDMTVPIYEAEGASHPFPAPRSVQDEADVGWTVAFFLSNNLAADEVPLPDDPAIALRDSPETLVAALRYRGNDTHERRGVAKRDLMQALSGSRWAADDQVYWARYDLAFAIPYLKRNEVHVRVSKSVKPEVVVSTKVDEACNSRTPAANRP